MTKKRWSAEEKYRIVMEALTTSEETAEICRKHGLSPNTFYPWREKFLEAAKAAMAGKSIRPRPRPCKRRTTASRRSWQSPPLPSTR